ncbi:Exopolyphosphatase/guanosine-5'-triphosphate, 3'-diphosphate pyrophosphatase [Sandaracinus amylolyticus]|nr:Exopolyphosphatase/guanosine-5'-triphosphate, 3'-diphosphate pyrophosphatase [Sandaracinus amylolyticus]
MLDDLGHITRLGRGVDARGRLADDAMDRAMSAMRDVVEHARATHGVRAIVAVGTSAMRDATNREVMIERASRELGVAIEVIDGAREAKLAFRGALPLVPIDDREEITVVDVGGGSTEIASGRGARLARSVSLDVGSVRLFERHLRADPPSRAQIDALIADVDRAIDASGARFAGSFVALAGTACTVAAVARGIDPEGANAVHGTSLSRDALHDVAVRLASMRIDERRTTPGVPPGREDVVAAGALLLDRIAERAGASSIEISNGGVRWGLALERLAPGAGGC